MDDKLSDNGSRRSSNRSTPSAGWKDDVSRSSSSSATARESPRPLTPPLTPKHSTTPSGGGVGVNAANNGTTTPTSGSGGETGTTPAQKNGNGLNLNMTAQQMRAMLANRKKYDPKKESMDLRKKHAIIQQM